jgi:hypothetical protein
MSKTQSKDTKLKWNFAMGLIHGIFFTGGQAFGNPNTILPVFLNNFTNSKMLIGFSSTIMGISNPNLVLFSLFFLITVFTLMGGVAVIPFYDIWGKAIPSTLRGRFFGYRQLLGGILAIGSGLIAKYILGNKNILFPQDFSFLSCFYLYGHILSRIRFSKRASGRST